MGIVSWVFPGKHSLIPGQARMEKPRNIWETHMGLTCCVMRPRVKHVIVAMCKKYGLCTSV